MRSVFSAAFVVGLDVSIGSHASVTYCCIDAIVLSSYDQKFYNITAVGAGPESNRQCEHDALLPMMHLAAGNHVPKTYTLCAWRGPSRNERLAHADRTTQVNR